MKIKIKKLDLNAVIPQYAKEGDAGMDLVATSLEGVEQENKTVYGTGLSVEIPEGYVGLIFPRSSIHKTNHMLANSVGVLDSGYRGEIKLIFRNPDNKVNYQIGDKIGQLIIMPYPQIEFEEVDSLSDSERGECGFGSTGK